MTSVPAASRPRNRRLAARYKRLFEEARRMLAVPGIRFVEGVSERVPVIAGTGLEVWEIVGPYKGLDEDLDELCDAFDWLTREQLEAALTYYRLFPEEVDARIAEDAWWDPDAGNVTYPIQL